MSSTFENFTYNSVDDAVNMLSPSDFMSVVDVASAYRTVSVRADHVQFQGLLWDFGQGPVWLLDRRLCFGLRCAPNIFNAISNFVVKIVNHWGATRIVNYLDDFLVIAEDEETCLHHRYLVSSAIQLLGFDVSWKKVTDPATTTTFLGITIDSLKMELSLPMEKVLKLKSFLNELLERGCATKKELERAGGLVSHCSYVVRCGRTFSRRIFDLAASYTRHSRSIPLDENIIMDFKWWLAFCGTFNGRACVIRDLHQPPEPCIIPSSAACEHLCLPPQFDSPPRNINVYELWPVVVGLKRWASHFSNCRMHVITDNMQVLAMLNTGRSCNKLCMSWLRELFWICFIHNTDISASYLRSADNVLADALSRAAYNGMSTKCHSLLDASNMCCSSFHMEHMEQIISRQRRLQDAAMAASTKKSRQSQLQCYNSFCDQYHLTDFPCDATQARLYAAFLSELMSPASVSNYLSAVWSHQRGLGFQAFSSDYILRLTLRGIRRLGASHRPPRHPISKQELHLLFQEINTLHPHDLCFWAAVTLAFRALLRKSHYTASPHNLCWRHVSIYNDHMVLVLPSSKTDQFSEHPLRIVLNSSPGSPLCPIAWLSELARVLKPLESDHVFRLPVPGGMLDMTYTWFSKKLKQLASAIGLNPDMVSPHSLRHGGASFMSALGSDLIDVRARGAWSSSAVFTYIHHSVESQRLKDLKLSQNFY